MESNGRTTVFIVEDNKVYAMMLDYILSKESVYRFENFKSGEDCLKQLSQNPKLIILDYNLPGINGYETLVEIKKYNPKIHVLVLSGNKDEALTDKLLNAGADDYILKQGHEEKQIIARMEALLEKDKADEMFYTRERNKMFFKRAVYSILLVVLFVLVLFYF